MREILSKHNLRHLQLLEFLLKNKQKRLSLKELSDSLNIPVRTLHADIHQINTYIMPVQIRVQSSGIDLSMPSNFSERYLYKKILEKSREFHLIEHIFINEGETIESLSEKLYTSPSTTKRMIKNINRILQKEGFYIHGKPLSFLGDERKLTQYMSFYFSEKYYFLEEFMTEKQQALITKLILNMMEKMGKEINYPEFKRRAIWIYLNCIRLKNSHDLPMNMENKYPYSLLYENKFCNDFYDIFGVHLADKTIKQLFYVMISDSYVNNGEELSQLVRQNRQQQMLCQEAELMLNTLSADLNIPLPAERKENLLITLLNIINLRGSLIYVLYDRREFFLSNISAYYINARNVIDEYIKNAFSFQMTKMERNELTYILLTHWPELYKKLRFLEFPVKVYLLIDSDVECGLLIKEELEAYTHYNMEVIILKTYSRETLSSISQDCILITNMPGIHDVNCPLLCIGEFLNRRDWEEFDKFMVDIIVGS